MINESALVSVVMPMRNAEAYVATAIESIIKQSYTNLELIIVDDLSSDRSCEIANSISKTDKRINILKGEGKGIAAAKNKGIAAAKGRYIMFCDADDLVANQAVEKLIVYLHKNADAGAVCAGFSMMDNNGNNRVSLSCEDGPCEITDELRAGNTSTHLCTFAIQKKYVDIIEGFREFFTSAEDIDFQLRLAAICRVFYIPDIVYFYRLHNSSIVHTQSSSHRVFFENTARLFCHQRIERGYDDLQVGNNISVPSEITNATDARNQLQGAMLGEAWCLHKKNKRIDAIKKGLQACLVKPTTLATWKSVLMLILK